MESPDGGRWWWWWWWFQCEFSIAISPAIRTCNASRRQDGSLEWPPPPSLPRPGKKRQMLHAVDHTEKGKSDSTRGETVFFSLPILVNCSARTINVIVFNCLRRMSVTFKMVSRDDKSCQASWAWSPPVVESVARSFGYFGKRPSSFLRPCPPEFRRDTAYIILFHQTSSNGIFAFVRKV